MTDARVYVTDWQPVTTRDPRRAPNDNATLGPWGDDAVAGASHTGWGAVRVPRRARARDRGRRLSPYWNRVANSFYSTESSRSTRGAQLCDCHDLCNGSVQDLPWRTATHVGPRSAKRHGEDQADGVALSRPRALPGGVIDAAI